MTSEYLNQEWTNVITTRGEMGDYSEDWTRMLVRFGEFGEPGFMIHPIKNFNASPELKFPPDAALYRCITYRGESGELLCAYGDFFSDGGRKPFFLFVHPDYLRQGIATKMADYVIQDWENEHGTPFPFMKSWGDLDAFRGGANNEVVNFVNKYVNNKIKE